MSLEKYIRDIQGFPKEGIMFKDITPLLMYMPKREKCLDLLFAAVSNQRIDKVIG
jgi:adenine phosphoribosyltransferase